MSSRGGGHHTDFSSHTLEKLKGMVQDAQPGKVEEIADHWMHVHDQMAGDAPDGSVRDLLDKAVADVREHWHGAAADAFAARAKILSTSLKHGALYAKNTSHTLRSAASDLREAKTAVMALQDTVGVEKGNGGILHAIGSKIKDGADWLADGGQRSDEGLNKDVAKGMSTKDALAKHADSLSRGREIALQAASHMEKLGASYNAKAQDLAGKPHRERWKPIDPPDRIVPPPAVAGSMGTGVASPRKGGSSSASTKTISGTSASGGGTSLRPVRTNGAPSEGGSASPVVHPSAPKAPRPGTSLDGVRGGVPTPVGPSRAGSGGPVVGGAPRDFGSGAGEPGVPSGGLPLGGGRGPLGGRPARPGSPVPGATPGGGRAGSGRSPALGAPDRTGQGARPPIGGTGGSGASGSGGARGRQGGLTRRPGGVVGEPAKPGAPGKGAQGGSGLHRSRGGGLNSGSGPSSRGRGPMGVPPGGRSGREDRERRGSTRPDYLVEDEETWVPQRDVVPGVIGVPSSEERGDTEAPVQQERELGPDSSEGSGRA